MKWINWILNGVLVILLVGMALIVALSSMSSPEGPGFLGYKGYNVITGSMEPAFSAGDFVVARMNEYENVKPNDIVTFQNSEGTVVTHRVYEREEDEVITKGDANNDVDYEKVTEGRYIGRVIWIIPQLGAILVFLQNPLFILLLGGILVIWLLFTYYSSDKKEENKE